MSFPTIMEKHAALLAQCPTVPSLPEAEAVMGVIQPMLTAQTPAEYARTFMRDLAAQGRAERVILPGPMPR